MSGRETNLRRPAATTCGSEDRTINGKTAPVDERCKNPSAPCRLDVEQARGLSQGESQARQLSELGKHAQL
jgi:hypothetical protein